MSDDRQETNPSDHRWHEHVVVRANARTENERAWAVCTDCEVIVGRMVLCGRPAKHGKPCRVALPVANGETACWVHR